MPRAIHCHCWLLPAFSLLFAMPLLLFHAACRAMPVHADADAIITLISCLIATIAITPLHYATYTMLATFHYADGHAAIAIIFDFIAIIIHAYIAIATTYHATLLPLVVIDASYCCHCFYVDADIRCIHWFRWCRRQLDYRHYARYCHFAFCRHYRHNISLAIMPFHADTPFH